MSDKEIILSVLRECNFPVSEFDKSANAVPSIVSLICRLRKFYHNGSQVANKMDQLHPNYLESFHKATSAFYQL